MDESIDRILEQWHIEKPWLDVSPMAVIGRLSRTALAVEKRLAITFRRHGLDSSSFDVLATLLRSGAPYRLTPAELAQYSMISTSAVAQRLNKLEERGFITREADPNDGRRTVVELTAIGRFHVEVALPDHLATERAVLEHLTSDEQSTLAALLSRVYATASI